MAEETAVVAPAIPTEVKAEAIVGEVVAKTEAAVKTVAVVAKDAEKKAVEFATAERVDITADEKLMVSKLENEFLRANAEIQRLQGVIQSAQAQFPNVVSGLVKKYSINPATHVFDNIELAFKKKQ